MLIQIGEANDALSVAWYGRQFMSRSQVSIINITIVESILSGNGTLELCRLRII